MRTEGSIVGTPLRRSVRALSALLIAFAVAWMTGFLSWAAADERIRLVSLFAGAVALAIPLVIQAARITRKLR